MSDCCIVEEALNEAEIVADAWKQRAEQAEAKAAEYQVQLGAETIRADTLQTRVDAAEAKAAALAAALRRRQREVHSWRGGSIACGSRRNGEVLLCEDCAALAEYDKGVG